MGECCVVLQRSCGISRKSPNVSEVKGEVRNLRPSIKCGSLKLSRATNPSHKPPLVRSLTLPPPLRHHQQHRQFGKYPFTVRPRPTWNGHARRAARSSSSATSHTVCADYSIMKHEQCANIFQASVKSRYASYSPAPAPSSTSAWSTTKRRVGQKASASSSTPTSTRRPQPCAT